MRKTHVVLYIGLLLVVSGFLYTTSAALPNQGNTETHEDNNNANIAPTRSAAFGAADDTWPPQTFEEWRNFLLEWNNVTLQDLENADPVTVEALNREAHIYEGWVNGTYTDEQKSQLLAELHHTPIVTPPICWATTDGNFEYTFSVTNLIYGEHALRVYAYIDYDKSDTNTGGGNRFSDGTSEKIYGPYGYYDPYPYETLPYYSSLDPGVDFMGSNSMIGWAHSGTERWGLGTVFFGSSVSGLPPGNHYLVIQILWKGDEFLLWPPFTYNAHYFWLTEFYSVTVSDDDTTPPTIPEENVFMPPPPFGYWSPIKIPGAGFTVDMEPVVTDDMSYIPVEVCAYDDASGIAPWITFNGVNYPSQYLREEPIDFTYFGGYIYGYWYGISVPNPRVPGHYTAEIKVWDNDNDWPGDRLSATRSFGFYVQDDDMSPPQVSWQIGGLQWAAGEIQFTLTVDATDARGIGDVLIQIGGYTFTSLGPHTMTLPPGQYTAYVSVTDGDNDWSGDSMTTSIQIPIVLDLSPPVTELSFQPYYSDGTSFFVTSATEFTLSATDDVSGAAQTYYRIDGGSWIAYTTGFKLSGPDGSYTIQYYSVDNVGNTETIKALTAVLDNTPPITSITLSGTHGSGVWFVSNVTVTLTAADGASGVKETLYSLDGLTWCRYADPLAITDEGTTVVLYRSIDNLGNMEPIMTQTLLIDKTPPTTGITIGAHYIDGTGAIYVTSETLITLLPYDATSGVAYTLYGINLPSGDWMMYTTGFKLSGPDGAYTLTYYSVDNAGNVEVESSTLVNLVSLKVDSYIASGCFHKITQFDALFIKKGCFDGYKLVATHPGQFYYIVKVMNNWPIPLDTMTIEFSIPVDFTLKGGHPIQVFMNCHSITRWCTIQGTSITVKHVPPGSTVWIIIRLDYALKGAVYNSLADFGIREYTFSGTVSAVAGTPQVPGGGLIGTYGYGATLTAHARLFRHFFGCAAHLNCHLRPNLVPSWPNHISA